MMMMTEDEVKLQDEAFEALVNDEDAINRMSAVETEQLPSEDLFDGEEDFLDLNPMEEGHDCYDMRDGILLEAAVSASREIEHIAELGAKCRTELFELVVKADLDKEKIKEKVRALQEFLVATEHRTDELTKRIERLVKKECSCTK